MILIAKNNFCNRDGNFLNWRDNKITNYFFHAFMTVYFCFKVMSIYTCSHSDTWVSLEEKDATERFSDAIFLFDGLICQD